MSGIAIKTSIFTLLCFSLTLGMDCLVHGFCPDVLADATTTTAMAVPGYAGLTALVAWVKT